MGVGTRGRQGNTEYAIKLTQAVMFLNAVREGRGLISAAIPAALIEIYRFPQSRAWMLCILGHDLSNLLSTCHPTIRRYVTGDTDSIVT
jgi:hypothetical protein